MCYIHTHWTECTAGLEFFEFYITIKKGLTDKEYFIYYRRDLTIVLKKILSSLQNTIFNLHINKMNAGA